MPTYVPKGSGVYEMSLTNGEKEIQ